MTSDTIEYKKSNLKSRSAQRWLMLFMACIMMVGSYYSLDIPAATKNQLESYMGGGDFETRFQLLYTIYAAPNVILPVFGGFLIDHFGIRWSLVLFMALILLGQIIVAIGFTVKSWAVVFLGRFIFGMGGESFTVANTAFITDWFIGSELAFSFGINLSFSRLGSVFNNIMSPYMVRHFEYLPSAYWFGALLCAICMVVVLITLPLDLAMDCQTSHRIDDNNKHFDRLDTFDELSVHNVMILDRKESTGVSSNSNSSGSGGGGGPEIHNRKKTPSVEAAEESRSQRQVATSKDSKPPNSNSLSTVVAAHYQDLLSFRLIFWLLGLSCLMTYGVVYPFNNISSSLLLERDYFKEPPPTAASACRLPHSGCQNDTSNVPENCPTSLWYQPPLPYNVVVGGVFYSQVTNKDVDCTQDKWRSDAPCSESSDSCSSSSSNSAGATEGCTVEYCDRLAVAESKASYYMSIPYTISAIFSPPLGLFIDRFGMRALISLAAPVILVLVHLTLALSDTISPFLPLVGQGFAFTGYVAVLWPCVPLLVEERVLGLAYGIVTGLQNFGVAVLPLVVAAVFNNSHHRYIPNVEYLFVVMGLMGAVVGVYLNLYDWKHGSVLNRGIVEEKVELGPVDEEQDVEGVESIDGKQYFQLRTMDVSGKN